MVRKRLEYESEPLESVDVDPFLQFGSWLQEAVVAGIPEPEAFVLATVDRLGAPSARTLLMRGFDRDGVVFYTNYQSRKALELTQNPRVAVVFLWLPLHRQVRLEGTVEVVEPETSDAYFASRPPESRLASAASPQSEVVADRAQLDALLAQVSALYPDGNVPRPAHWGGYRIRPHLFEFWQGRRARFHDRFRYRQSGGEWIVERLAP